MPTREISNTAINPMTLLRAFAITIASGVAFGVGGGIVGYGVGHFLPDFYRTIFDVPQREAFNAAHFGLALGLTQGLLMGVGVGLVIVVAVTWYNARSK
jgi:hypothetical protein